MLTASQISQLLATQDLGLVSNEPDILPKSTVFASLSAHGVLSAIGGSGERLHDDWDKSVFLYDTSTNATIKCLDLMQNQPEVAKKKQALKTLMHTTLDWKKITLAWVKHLEKLDKL